jgi:dipeptidyl aminopeptidase/acylaminoacyl peptidase
MPTAAPYGSWRSPITTALITGRTISLGQVVLDGEDTYWIEGRPEEGGRYSVVHRFPNGTTTDAIPAAFNARTRVHEYGGGALVVADGVLYFSHDADQRLYRQRPGASPEPITPPEDLRFADGDVDHRRNRLICVCEDHRATGREAVNSVVAIDLSVDGTGLTRSRGDRGENQSASSSAVSAAPREPASSAPNTLVSGNDFYAWPRISPDGRWLAWATWNHPNLPWDDSEVWLGELDDAGAVIRAERVAGGPGESVFQPQWSPKGTLHFISDRTGWWNLYRYQNGQVEPVLLVEAELATAAWTLGLSTYAFLGDGRLVCTYADGGGRHLVLIDPTTLASTELPTPYSEIREVRASGDRIVFIGGTPTELPVLVELRVGEIVSENPSLTRSSGERGEIPEDLLSAFSAAPRETSAPPSIVIIRRSSDIAVDPALLSRPQSIEFPTEGGRTAFAYYYPPHNPAYVGPAGELPPLLVRAHGGPTSSTGSSLNLEVQYWTSRGFAYLDVNYGGSTGYGRAYRQRLNGQWGVVDLDDSRNGARYLVEQKLADPRRLAIRGTSAGGYTTLTMLATRKDFSAGAAYFGIADLEVWARDTHKFESRYLDNLIGPYPARRDLYRERSAIHHLDQISAPLLVLQGLEDKIVPPNQAEIVVEALRARKSPVAYLAFPGEQHGFRMASTIKRATEAELSFYGQVFHFPLGEAVEPLVIENW